MTVKTTGNRKRRRKIKKKRRGLVMEVTAGFIGAVSLMFIGIVIYLIKRGEHKAKSKMSETQQENLNFFSTELQEKYLHNKEEMKAKAELQRQEKKEESEG